MVVMEAKNNRTGVSTVVPVIEFGRTLEHAKKMAERSVGALIHTQAGPENYDMWAVHCLTIGVITDQTILRLYQQFLIRQELISDPMRREDWSEYVEYKIDPKESNN